MELPLPALGDWLFVGPLAHSPSADSEKSGELRVGVEPEPLFGVSLRNLHCGKESRPLDVLASSTLARRAGNVSSEMETMAERLHRALALRQLKPADLIERTKLSRAGVYFLLDGTTTQEKVRATTIAKISKVLGVRRDWLLHGRLPIEGPDDVEDGWDDVKGYAQSVGLGDGQEAQEYAETHKLKFRAESLRRQRLTPDSLAVMYGRGDSMLPRIRTGDAVLFDTSDTRPADEALFVVMAAGVAGNEYSAKRCRQFGDNWFFESLNPEGDHNWRKPRAMSDKRHPIQIIGRVRWIGSWEG